MAKFYAPYNFVPVTGKCNGQATAVVDADAVALGSSEHPARHDVWLPSTHSGRLLCALTTRSPLVLGARQEPADAARGEDSPTRVLPYVDADGHAAVPASSLRGLTASIAEALSQSTLRVLQDRSYSVRKAAKPEEALSAVGRLCLATDGSIRLQPMSLPLLKSGAELPKKWLRTFKIDPDEDVDPADMTTWVSYYLPSYVDGYVPHGSGVRVKPGSFLAQHGARKSSTDDERTHWYGTVEEAKLIWDAKRKSVRYADAQLHQDGKTLRNRLVAAPKRNQGPKDLPGRIKVLGFEGHESQVPRSKKHELFIAEPEDAPPPLLPITKNALDNFRALVKDAELREPEFLPFRNAGAAPDLEDAARQGQLVFFDVEETPSGVRVSEFSYSGIWRRRVKGSLHAAFARSHPALPPLDAHRRGLTPAELLFGVVREEKDDGDKAAASALQALASRVRFSDAIAPSKPQLGAQVKLQILSSPKPPSPSMYFGQSGAPVNKARLNLEQHAPNGRKVYLPFPESQRTAQNAASRAAEPRLDKQKMVVTPIPTGQTFYFEVSYENLSPAELGLLLTSLRPAPAFEHRLGLAKPLGFGHVRIDVLAMQDRNRVQRYTADDFLSPPAGPAFVDVALRPERLPARYAHWQSCLDGAPQAEWKADAPAASFGHPSLVDQDTLKILSKLGDVEQLERGVPVQYPRANSQVDAGGRASAEDELFEWFMNNERGGSYQGLGRVKPDARALPTLDTNDPPPKRS